MNAQAEVAVTVSKALYASLRAEAKRLGVSVEWLVAGLIVDTMEDAPVRPSAA
jgi:hypothetical protein